MTERQRLIDSYIRSAILLPLLVLALLAWGRTQEIPAGSYPTSDQLEVMTIVDDDAPAPTAVKPAVKSRFYWPVRIADMPHTKHTHVSVIGKVTLVKVEDDGDKHQRISDVRGHFIVAECIPELPCAEAKVGDYVMVQGIAREDKEHGWYEVHPVEKLTVLKAR